jgi:hypothetical protein
LGSVTSPAVNYRGGSGSFLIGVEAEEVSRAMTYGGKRSIVEDPVV